jgi:hypothetical protein
MVRVARPGALIAAYIWDYAGQMPLVRTFWQAASALDPAASAHDRATRYPHFQPEPLSALFADAGLRAVEVHPIDLPMPFRDFDDYWQPFLLGGSSPAQRYVTALPEEQRLALREHLRSTLPIAADGSIPLVARAWAVQGTK